MSFIFFGLGLLFGLRGCFLRKRHHVSNRIRSRGFQDLALAPEGRQSAEKSGAGFVGLSCLTSDQSYCQASSHRAARARPVKRAARLGAWWGHLHRRPGTMQAEHVAWGCSDMNFLGLKLNRQSMILVLEVWAGFLSNLALGPVPMGQIREMWSSPKITSGDQF